jgi:hypothetical protein
MYVCVHLYYVLRCNVCTILNNKCVLVPRLVCPTLIKVPGVPVYTHCTPVFCISSLQFTIHQKTWIHRITQTSPHVCFGFQSHTTMTVITMVGFHVPCWYHTKARRLINQSILNKKKLAQQTASLTPPPQNHKTTIPQYHKTALTSAKLSST